MNVKVGWVIGEGPKAEEEMLVRWSEVKQFSLLSLPWPVKSTTFLNARRASCQ